MKLGFNDLRHVLTLRNAFVTQEVGDALGASLWITHKGRVINLEQTDARDGPLVAYRWRGESEIKPEH